MRDAKVLMIAACLGFVAASPNLLAQAGGGTALPHCGQKLNCMQNILEKCCQDHVVLSKPNCDWFNHDYYRERITPVQLYEHGFIVDMCVVWSDVKDNKCCGNVPIGLPVTPTCPGDLKSTCTL